MAYIERDIFINNELIPLVKRLDLCHPKQKKGVLMAISKLKEAPAADVAEVRHGKWEKQQFIGRSGFFSVKDFTCSNCFENFAVEQGKGLMNYCPNCGAKMDEKDGK